MSVSSIESSGRAHIQRDLKHLVRDVRHDVKSELKELRAAGDEASLQKAADVRDAYFAFRDQVQGAFTGAGRGGSFDAASVPEGLRLAMVDFTARLAALNGTAREDVDTVVKDPAAEDAAPLPVEDLLPGSLFAVLA